MHLTGLEHFVIGSKVPHFLWYRFGGSLELGPLGRVICLGDWTSVRMCSLRSISVGLVEVSRYRGDSALRA